MIELRKIEERLSNTYPKSEPALELHNRAAPSVGGKITAESVQPQREIPEEGRKKTFLQTPSHFKSL